VKVEIFDFPNEISSFSLGIYLWSAVAVEKWTDEIVDSCDFNGEVNSSFFSSVLLLFT
jgi:hypothetical protein